MRELDDNYTTVSLGSRDVEVPVPNPAIPSQKNVEKLTEQVMNGLRQGVSHETMLDKLTARKGQVDSETLTQMVFQAVQAQLTGNPP